ncbi:amino acid transporter, AAT family [Dendrosporobacter quercicolus]|uniref:Amino acid transporter, AAT family n=2 Tax=Dendrosporobacter quercicolus TaxID=146817 RepID=A0A1G9U6Q0_9FIRM|nr:amino acid permease [Dendrosporobacter quercicolus]SDM55649.1 amino acid transporter, AAT family [Dendrosporobacter quercicolus]
MDKNMQGLSAWQLVMLALGTVIGGSFFLGSAVAIKAAGPAVLIAYLLAGGLVFVILYALSEMTVADAAPGSFRTFAERAFGPAAGFVVGWVYWTGLVLAMSSEATAVAIFLQNWFPAMSLGLMGAFIIAVVTLFNLLGADKLSKLESGLAIIKLLAIVGFIVTGLALIAGLMPGTPAIGSGVLFSQPLLPGGLGGIAGSMLIVMFTYAGFEIIGLAASEADNPHTTIPRAIRYTVFGLLGLYVTAVAVLLPLTPTAALGGEQSPLVTALARWGLGWAGAIVNIVLVTAILSTMLAAMFGLGRMLRSLADEGHAPEWIKDRGDIPRRGILFSGAAMLTGLGLAFLLPEQVYLFLVSAGGFSLLASYAVILVTHYKYRQSCGCPPTGHCQLPGYPYTSWLAMAGCLAIIAGMPLIPGQGSGLAAGLVLVGFYISCYFVKKRLGEAVRENVQRLPGRSGLAGQTETSQELAPLKDGMAAAPAGKSRREDEARLDD